MILGIDYGLKRIGLAIADPGVGVALPLATLSGRNDVTRDARNVADVAAEQGASVLVVGLPLNMDGGEGEQSEVTRRFAGELGRLSGLVVHLQDERLSSDAALEALGAAGVRSGKRKGLVDRIAAQKILQAYLDG
ncbi:MAG: Holliday junction resolvase RuvX [Phycisphaerae bacterium]